jgi:hypothetical protein
MVGRLGSVGGSGVSVSSCGLRGVLSLSGVGDLGNETVVVISGVGGGLDTSIGKSDGERSSNISFGILGLGFLEVGLGVIIGYSIFIGIWLRSKLDFFVGGRVVGWGRGAIGWWVVSSDGGNNDG